MSRVAYSIRIHTQREIVREVGREWVCEYANMGEGKRMNIEEGGGRKLVGKRFWSETRFCLSLIPYRWCAHSSVVLVSWPDLCVRCSSLSSFVRPNLLSYFSLLLLHLEFFSLSQQHTKHIYTHQTILYCIRRVRRDTRRRAMMA